MLERREARSTSSGPPGRTTGTRRCGVTTPTANVSSSWLQTAAARSAREWLTKRRTSGLRRRGCTSTATSSSTRRASPPASRPLRRSAGGRGRTSRVDGDPRREQALALWANTTPGLIAFWWVASRQQQGRANLTISQLPRLTALDVRTLNDEQLEQAERLFAEFAGARVPASQRGL